MNCLLPFQSPPVERLDWSELRARDIVVEVLRLDLVHPDVGGNKWFKLALNLEEARARGYDRVLSFGGAYSNHLRALAAAAEIYGIASTGVVRGELVQPLNPVLKFASTRGMSLFPISRADYRRQNEAEFISALHERWGDFYLIPTGGANELGVLGSEAIVEYLPVPEEGIPAEKTWLVLACGTGTTMAGIINGLAGSRLPRQVLGIAVMGGGEFLTREISCWLRDPDAGKVPWRVETAYAFGGFARTSPTLDNFVVWFRNEFGIAIEPVYTGKAFKAVFDMALDGRIPAGSRVTVLHTGGVYNNQ